MRSINLKTIVKCHHSSNQNRNSNTIKYLPKKDNKAAIDSIVFTFDKFNGLNRISTFEIFEAVKELKQISPSGVD